jgi:hypothetical protein
MEHDTLIIQHRDENLSDQFLENNTPCKIMNYKCSPQASHERSQQAQERTSGWTHQLVGLDM